MSDRGGEPSGRNQPDHPHSAHSAHSADGDGEIPFEAALERLEELVGALEGGELDLEASLATFEEGVKLVRLCQERLHAARVRVSQLEETAEGPRERPLPGEPGE